MSNDFKNILVMQTAFIGDVIMSTSIFPALKDIYPNSKIDVVTIPAASIILKHNPHINNTYSFDKKSSFSNKLISFFGLVNKLKKNKYDIGISLQQSATSSYLLKLSKIKFTVGRQKMKFVDKKIPYPANVHNKDRVLSLLSAFSENKFNYNTEIYVPKEISEKIELKLFKNDLKNICIAPGSVRETKKLPTNKYINIINNLNEYNVYLIGAPNERDLCEEIKNRVNHKNIVNLAGELNLIESSAIVKKSDLLICNDSAPLHIANAVDTPVFAFFGPTVKKFGCYPYREKDRMIEVDLDCRPCGKHGSNTCPLGHHKCMKDIDMNLVKNYVDDLLN